MKIKKEFVPLILSGEKKYEFRNSNDKEGMYIIDNQYYYLLQKELVAAKTIPNDYHKTFYSYLSKKIKQSKLTLDAETKKWLKENSNNYFMVNTSEYKYECYIYEWIKLNELPLFPFTKSNESDLTDEEREDVFGDIPSFCFQTARDTASKSLIDLILYFDKNKQETIKFKILDCLINIHEIKQLEII